MKKFTILILPLTLIFTTIFFYLFTQNVSAEGPAYIDSLVMGGGGTDDARSVFVDNNDNIYITGGFSETVDFNTTATGADDIKSSGGSLDGFITKVNSDETYAWTVTFTGASEIRVYDVAIGDTGDIYLTGYFIGTANFNTIEQGAEDIKISKGQTDMFVTKLNSDGSYGWTRTVGGALGDLGYSIEIDKNDDIYVSGWVSIWKNSSFSGLSVEFNTTGDGESDLKEFNDFARRAFVIKYNEDDSYAYGRAFGAGSYNVAFEPAFDSEGNIYLAGYFQGITDFNTTGEGESDIRTSNGSGDIFILKYNYDGSYGWVKTTGGLLWDTAISLSFDSDDNLYVAGHFRGDVDFNITGLDGSDMRSSKGDYDLFVTKMNPDGTHSWTRTIGGEFADELGSLLIDVYDNIYITGFFQGNNVQFNTTGSGESDIRSSNGDRDIFLTKFNSNGGYGWTYTAGSALGEQGYGLAIDSNDTIYLAGNLRGSNVELNTTGYGQSDMRSSASDDDILLLNFYNDDEFPAITTTTYINNKILEGSATDKLTIVSSVEYKLGDGDWTLCEAEYNSLSEDFTCDLSSVITTDGSYPIKVRSTDSRTNTGEVLGTFVYDTTSPTGTIFINTNSTYTNTQVVTLTLSATDNLSGVSQMMISNTSDFTGASWESYSTTKTWTLPSGDGEKTVYVKFKDNAGNESTVVSDTIILKTIAVLTLDLTNLDYDKTEEVYTKTVGEDVIVKGTAEQNTKVVIKALTENGVVVYETELTVGADGKWELNLGDILGVGTYLVQISTTDPAGNIAYSEFTLMITEAEIVEPLPQTGEHILAQLLIGGMLALSSAVVLRKDRYKVGTK